jgi:hypoxanthine phosphoribosyltransferase
MDYQHPDIARILISENAIQARVREIAAQISRDYGGVERLYLVGVLKGAFIFLADLARAMTQIEGMPPHIVYFMAVSSYGYSASSGEVRLVMDLREPILDQHVLLVEDIIDSGQTLNYLMHTLKGRGPASLRSCALVQKERPGLDVRWTISASPYRMSGSWGMGWITPKRTGRSPTSPNSSLWFTSGPPRPSPAQLATDCR